jgi:hypothetical protein
MDRRHFIKLSGLTSLVTMITPSGLVQTYFVEQLSELDQRFKNPTGDALPYTMWFWMNGHVTREGITKDLEAMKRVGIGGVFNFDAGTGIPKGPVEYLSAEWLELKVHAVSEAARLGMAFTMHNCPGWSSSGGPWITPDKAMQQVTWSETFIKGAKEIKIRLPKPFQRYDYYKEIAVLAYPSLPGEEALENILSEITNNAGIVPLKLLRKTDYSLEAHSEQSTAWLQFKFNEPVNLKALSFLTERRMQEKVETEEKILIEVSDNGIDFKTIHTAHLHNDAHHKELLKSVQTDLAEIKATYIRFKSDHSRNYKQICFSQSGKFEDWKKRANFLYNGTGKKEIKDESNLISFGEVQDLSSNMNEEGELRWSAPDGNWTILRMGYTPVGEINHAAPDSGVGLECDKYSQEAISFHFKKMMEILLPAMELLVKEGRMGLEIDSYEVGMQNWTPGFENIFRENNQYDIYKFLPALTGRLVTSIDTTGRFLLDLRRTQADLIADNYYGKFNQLCKEQKIISFIQPYDRGPMEEMQIGSRADSVMGEFWNGLSSIFQNNLMMRRTCKLASSIAHVNAQKITGAEAFTGEPESARWQEYPFMMKATGDKAFASGINRMIIHRFAHQPYENALPGMTMGPWGIHFDRTNTWWEQGSGWLKYLARCQSLLQQGLFVADLAYFTGEDPGVYTVVNREELNPPPPVGYEYDLINSEVLIKKAKVVNGRLTLPDGMSYKILILQKYKFISLELLQKLEYFVRAGLIVVGAPPDSYPGLTATEDTQEKFKEIVSNLWGKEQENIERKVGQGSVIWGKPLAKVLNAMNLLPDFEYSSLSGDAPVFYLHRKTEKEEIYFISNQRRSREEIVAGFRVGNKKPMQWNALTGTVVEIPVYELKEGRIKIPLSLEPYGSMFIVFREETFRSGIKSISLGQKKIWHTEDFPKVERKLYPQIQNNFTISFWAKPELMVMLRTDNFMEYVKDPWTDYYAVYPTSGKMLYGKGHATAGLTVGRNGIAVWEHADERPVMTLAAPAVLSGWSHIAMVYEEGIPSVYLNGKFIEKGKISENNVHPGTEQVYLSEGASYYNGDMTTPEIYDKPLSVDKIKAIVRASYKTLNFSKPVVELSEKNKNSLLFYENGKYILEHEDRLQEVNISDVKNDIILNGAWEIKFPEALGAPEKISIPGLRSLHEHPDPGVKYFSGTATYSKKFTLPSDYLKKGQLVFVDLGRVEIIAEVFVNEKPIGLLWSRPYRVEITEALKPGVNEIKIQVTNHWVNRLIGDEQFPEKDKFVSGNGNSWYAGLIDGAIEELPEWYLKGKPKPKDGRITFTTWKHYTKDSPLLESGLIGPVVLQSVVLETIV